MARGGPVCIYHALLNAFVAQHLEQTNPFDGAVLWPGDFSSPAQ